MGERETQSCLGVSGLSDGMMTNDTINWVSEGKCVQDWEWGVELHEGEEDNPLDLNSFVLVVGWDFKN